MEENTAAGSRDFPGFVIGIGQCTWDYLAPIDAYPLPDSKEETGVWTEEGGGPVATALVTLARLGMRSRFHGVVGDDEAGKRIRRGLLAAGIDVSGVRVRPGAVSQTAFICVERGSGRRTIFWQRPTGGSCARTSPPTVFSMEGPFCSSTASWRRYPSGGPGRRAARGYPSCSMRGG